MGSSYRRRIPNLISQVKRFMWVLDTGRKSWKVSIPTEELEHRTFTQPPKPEVIVGYLRKHSPGAKYQCVYEAGYFGFWTAVRKDPALLMAFSKLSKLMPKNRAIVA